MFGSPLSSNPQARILKKNLLEWVCVGPYVTAPHNFTKANYPSFCFMSIPRLSKRASKMYLHILLLEEWGDTFFLEKKKGGETSFEEKNVGARTFTMKNIYFRVFRGNN